MTDLHVGALFSDAYERILDGEQRERFDSHLTMCESCRTGYSHYRVTVDSLRSLPKAAMPIAVRLPSSPPVVSAATWWERLLALPLALRAGGTAAAVALAALGVMVLGFHPGALSTAQLGVTGPRVESPLSIAAPDRGTSLSVCVPTSAPGERGGTTPAGFANQVTRTDPSRPTQQLVLATTGSTVSRGSTVLVYARLTTTSSVQQSVPCVELRSAVGALAAVQGNEAAQNTGTLVRARPTADVASGGIPLQTVTIPSTLAPGTVVYLDATVPAGYPAGDGAQLDAVLTLTVE